MACEFEVCFPAGRPRNGTSLAMEALDEVESLEGSLSYFRPTSQISCVNREAAARPVEVDAGLFDLLVAAMRLCEETQGAYDVTSAPLWEAWGFASRSGRIPSEAEIADALARVGSRFVELDPVCQTVRFHRPGVSINLGSVGKGYALDVCARSLLASGMTDFLLHGGRSSVLAHGNPCDVAEQVPSGGSAAWEVGVRRLGQSGRRLGVLRLADRALGTSSTQFQFFRHEGRRYGHLLDPRTGQPAEGVLSTTVTAPKAFLADALSTAFFVMGPAASLDYCRSHPEIGMVMVCQGCESNLPEVHAAGFRPGDVHFDET